MVLWVLLGGMGLFLLLNVPVGISIALAVMLYIYFLGSVPMKFLAQNLFTACDSFPLMAIPFFILAGSLMKEGGLSKRLVALAEALIGYVPGGFAFVTILSCMFFGAVSGSSPATVAAIGSIMIPAMVERGYSKEFATALAAASGGLGVIIPPSIPMVVYGVATGASIGKMFLGGFGPGVVFGGALMVLSYFVAKKAGYVGSGEKFSIKKVLIAFKDAIWALMIPLVILGGIYSGVFTPTEASVVAVFYGFFVGKFVYKELSWRDTIEALKDTAVMVGTILIILGAGTAFAKVLTIEGIPDKIVAMFQALTQNKLVLLLLINILLLIVGCVMETLSAILILGPILYKVVEGYGVDLIHFGIIMVVNLAIGFITPPVGVNLFVACGLTGMSFDVLSKAIFPFVIALIFALFVITYVPSITMFIPKLLGY
ncbi:MAG: TRAP transporter large permease [Synergistetes bacterium]|nr:TRAP transporter large permease [Synergistota bacterium]MDW8191651.1 TRAP transporter large permease [Synergistota bacterium]